MRPRLVVALFALAACAEKPTSPATVAGTYALDRVDGAALPVLSPDGTTMWRYEAGTLTLGADGRYAGLLQGTVTDARGATRFANADSGVWTLAGTAFEMRSTRLIGARVSGSAGEDAVTYLDGRHQFSYRRR